MMKKELRKMKVVQNIEEPFKKESKTYYIRDDNDRSRYDNWRNDLRTRGYVRSDSHPKFFRTTSKNNYVRDSSKFRIQNSNVRSNSKPGYNSRPNSNARPGSNVLPRGNTRPVSKSQERPKVEIFKKIDMIEKKFEKFEKVQNEMKEILKTNCTTKYY